MELRSYIKHRGLNHTARFSFSPDRPLQLFYGLNQMIAKFRLHILPKRVKLRRNFHLKD